MKRTIYIGFDPREAASFAVARYTCRRRLTQQIPINGLVLSELQAAGLYTRPISWRDMNGHKVMWDDLSGAPMSTQHANARFLTPHLARTGWALFSDGDFLYRSNVARMFEGLDQSKAVYCVKHRHEPVTTTKMDGQVQTVYPRKNWTSFIVFNCDHEANKALTLELINSVPGRDLHRLCWLEDDELIGELDPAWNWLVGHSDPSIDPKAVHFTDGPPEMSGYENVPFADEWRDALDQWGR